MFLPTIVPIVVKNRQKNCRDVRKRRGSLVASAILSTGLVEELGDRFFTRTGDQVHVQRGR